MDAKMERTEMFGSVLEADFEAGTLTFQMTGEYYAAAGQYKIAPLSEITPPIVAHSKTEYKRLREQGANVLPPASPAATPRTDALFDRHVSEQSEFSPGTSYVVLQERAVRQVKELLELARQLERELAEQTRLRQMADHERDGMLEKLIAANDRWQQEWDARKAAESQLAAYKDSFPTCEQHAVKGGARSGCLECAYIKLNCALSRISYLCGTPNEMEVSDYDFDYNEAAVVAAVEKKLAAARADERERCAKVCDELADTAEQELTPVWPYEESAAAIRALGEAK